MIIEEEIQKIINDFVEKLEEREGVLTAFNIKVQEIISKSKQKFNLETNELDKTISETKISEQEYRQKFLEIKERIIKETKQELDLLIQNLEQ